MTEGSNIDSSRRLPNEVRDRIRLAAAGRGPGLTSRERAAIREQVERLYSECFAGLPGGRRKESEDEMASAVEQRLREAIATMEHELAAAADTRGHLEGRIRRDQEELARLDSAVAAKQSSLSMLRGCLGEPHTNGSAPDPRAGSTTRTYKSPQVRSATDAAAVDTVPERVLALVRSRAGENSATGVPDLVEGLSIKPSAARSALQVLLKRQPSPICRLARGTYGLAGSPPIAAAKGDEDEGDDEDDLPAAIKYARNGGGGGGIGAHDE